MLRRSSYTVDGVVERVGAPAVAALARHEPAAVRRALSAAADPLAVLVRLLLLGDDLDTADVAPLLPLAECSDLVEMNGSRVRCPVEVAPYGDDDRDWWVVSDRADGRGRPRRPDHVLGVGGASTTLAQITPRLPVTRGLDLGTGCGVQALHLGTHCDTVVATDLLPHALRLAATSFALSGVDVELRPPGDLTAPVEPERFDLVVCNPPFVVGPARRFAYRDAGRAADELSRQAVRSAARVLADGGVAVLLVNWLHVSGEDWRDRASTWIADLECDAWLIERDVADPVSYVSTWAADAAEDDEGDAMQWLAWLAALRAEAVGFGWVVLRRAAPPHRVVVEAVDQPVDQPLGAQMAGWLDRVAWLRGRDDDALLAARLRAAPGVRRDVAETPTSGGWQPVGQALRLETGFRWLLPCDDAVAAVVAGCDATTPLRVVVGVLAASLGLATDEVVDGLLPAVRGLVERGVLLPS